MTRRAKPGPRDGVRTNAKLTPEQVALILAKREKGLSVRQIANSTRIPYSQVSGVIYCGNGTRTLQPTTVVTQMGRVKPAKSTRPNAQGVA